MKYSYKILIIFIVLILGLIIFYLFRFLPSQINLNENNVSLSDVIRIKGIVTKVDFTNNEVTIANTKEIEHRKNISFILNEKTKFFLNQVLDDLSSQNKEISFNDAKSLIKKDDVLEAELIISKTNGSFIAKSLTLFNL
jgi:hypothetical protein